MSKLSVSMLVALSFVLLGGQSSSGQQPHKEWFKYLEGSWNFEVEALGIKGVVTRSLISKEDAVLGKFVTDDGVVTTEIIGFRPDTKEFTASGYGSKGNYWQLTFDEFSAQKMTGRMSGRQLDGRSFTGDCALSKDDEDHMTFRSSRTFADGEKMTMVAKQTRVSRPSDLESTKEEFDELVNDLSGRWVGDMTWIGDWTESGGKKGDKVTGYYEATSTEDGHALQGKFFGGNMAEAHFYYYDPGAKRIRGVWVTSGGDITHTTYYKKNSNWHLRQTGAMADGRKTTLDSHAVISDDGNTWTWFGTGTIGDQPTDPLNDVWKRVSK